MPKVQLLRRWHVRRERCLLCGNLTDRTTVLAQTELEGIVHAVCRGCLAAGVEDWPRRLREHADQAAHEAQWLEHLSELEWDAPTVDELDAAQSRDDAELAEA